MPHVQALTRLKTASPSKQELQPSWLQTQSSLEDPGGQGVGGLTGRMKEQHFFPGPHKANRNDTEIVRGEISSMFFQNKWEKRQRECTVWRAGKKDAKQLWHKLPVLQDSSTSTALGKQKNVPMLYGLMLGHGIRPTDHYIPQILLFLY